MSPLFRVVLLVAVVLASLSASSCLTGRKAVYQNSVSPSRPQLDWALQYALRSIREDLLPEGYWPTAITGSPRFENPGQEFNTYVSSMVVSLLDPVASRAGLDDVLEQARNLLRGQIEETGLVRYYGRPDLTDIPRLWCKDITPDADDTALVWLVAPSDERARLDSMLRTFKIYRTPEGFYHTWLAPPEEYRCIIPGDDPNPIDVGLQMHLFLLFMRYDPESAASLCKLIGPAMNEDRFWVYYAATPIVPLLREAELARQGCPVRVPERRLVNVSPGQEIWIELAKALRDALLPEKTSPSPESVTELLSRVAAQSFQVVKEAPPFLYHGDVSNWKGGSYWSLDFGYAMWLRLYFETFDIDKHHAARRSADRSPASE